MMTMGTETVNLKDLMSTHTQNALTEETVAFLYQALLEEIYDSIVKEEIKLKDEDPTLLRKGKPEEKNALLDALNVFNLGRSALQKAEDDAERLM